MHGWVEDWLGGLRQWGVAVLGSFGALARQVVLHLSVTSLESPTIAPVSAIPPVRLPILGPKSPHIRSHASRRTAAL